MPLAAILGVCALLTSSPATAITSAQTRVAFQEAQPQQETPPPDSPQQPAPAPTPDSAQPAQTPSPDTSAKKPDSAATATTATKTKKKSRKPKPAAQPDTGPSKVVVRNGSTADPTVQLAPTLTDQQAATQLQNTNKLLATTDTNLKKISSRQLSPAQQDTANQVRKYMEQAKAAIAAGDLPRARNLAFKARLLSDDLAKP